MENKNAQKILDTAIAALNNKKFDASALVEDLKKVREFALIEENPTVTKALRLAYEHLDNNDAFLIAIPEDDAIEDDAEEIDSEPTFQEENDLESLAYFLSLFLDIEKKNNILDLKEYNALFLSHANA